MNNLTATRSGILFVVSAPSGAGKTTLIGSLREYRDFVYSISCTTRAPRPAEVHGEHYFFMSDSEFQTRITSGDFLEYAQVHGRFYGTLKSHVLDHLQCGRDVLIDVDTVGAANIRACQDPVIQNALVDVFIMPPGLEELSRRLRGRGTETEDQVHTRLRNAASEMKNWPAYRYTILSATMQEDVDNFRSIMLAERSVSRRLHLSFT